MQINNDGNTVSQAADIPVQLNVNVPSVSYRSCYFHNLSFSINLHFLMSLNKWKNYVTRIYIRLSNKVFDINVVEVII